jgi:hypothetical protein
MTSGFTGCGLIICFFVRVLFARKETHCGKSSLAKEVGFSLIPQKGKYVNLPRNASGTTVLYIKNVRDNYHLVCLSLDAGHKRDEKRQPIRWALQYGG